MREKWQQREVDFLKSLAGEYPFDSIVRKFAQKSRQGWPKRTRTSLESKIHDLGLSVTVIDSHLVTLKYIRLTLGCSDKFSRKLIKNKSITAITMPVRYGRFWYLERKNLAKLAKNMPRLFCEFDKLNLLAVIEDEEAVNAIIDSKSKTASIYAIRCIETKEEWNNAVIAGKQFNVSRKAIQAAIKEQRPVTCLNLTFEYLSPLTPRIKTQPDAPVNDEPIN